MELAMHGWMAALVLTAAFALYVARARAVMAAAGRIYNESRDVARRR